MTRVETTLDALDLAQYIRPGHGIVFQQGCGEALSLTEKLVQQRAAYSGAGIFFGSGFSKTFQPEHADHLRFKGIGGIGTLRKLAAAGKLDPIPCHISSIEGLLANGAIRSDVVLLQVSAANDKGEHSFGLVNDYVRTAMSKARVVIAEINAQVPWVHCDRPLRADEISVAVHSDRQPLELPAAPFGDLERRIAAHLADFIPDRATLQVGIGAVPEAVVAMLSDRRDLGVHSGMIGDSRGRPHGARRHYQCAQVAGPRRDHHRRVCSAPRDSIVSPTATLTFACARPATPTASAR